MEPPLLHIIATRLKRLKKLRSQLPAILERFCDFFAIPLQIIFEKVYIPNLQVAIRLAEGNSDPHSKEVNPNKAGRGW